MDNSVISLKKGTFNRDLTLNAKKPANDPSNFGSYHVGAQDVKAFNPPPAPGGAGSSAPTILAGLPSLVLPGLALVALFALLRLFRNPLLRLLGVNPVQNDSLYRSPYGTPYGQDPYRQPMYGAAGPGPADVEASLQQMLQNATPDEAAQLRLIAERMKARSAPQGSIAARPAQWVTPEPIPASPAEALTPEEKREIARQKARAQAQQAQQQEVKASTQTWSAKQVQAEQAMAGAAPTSFNQLEEDQRLVAVASVVLTAFVVAEADARGYQTR